MNRLLRPGFSRFVPIPPRRDDSSVHVELPEAGTSTTKLPALDSNQEHLVPKTSATTNCASGQRDSSVAPLGLEPRTSVLKVRSSNHLNYRAELRYCPCRIRTRTFSARKRSTIELTD